jgi:putative transposase
VLDHDVIVIEDLNVKGMTRKPKPKPGGIGRYERNGAAAKAGLNKSVLDAGFGEFRRQLEYKCERYGRTLIVVNRWYPSSKTCSACGHLVESLSLKTRHWTCPACDARHDRDYNAAKNILAAGLAVARTPLGDACGAGVSHEAKPRAAGGEPGTPGSKSRNPCPPTGSSQFGEDFSAPTVRERTTQPKGRLP